MLTGDRRDLAELEICLKCTGETIVKLGDPGSCGS